jgi:hypothetical protein
MADDREHASTGHPLHGEPRPKLSPVLAVVGLVVVLAIIFIVITVLQQNT